MKTSSISTNVPETLRDVVRKLYSYGFELRQENSQIWVLVFPPGDSSGYTEVAFSDRDLSTGLLRVLRAEEAQRGILYRYEQFDERWGRIVYGNAPGDTTIAAAGCGPSSLAIVLQYLMNNGSRPRDACQAVTPQETAQYASTHGRVSGHGTAGDAMIRGIRERWPGFNGSRVTLEQAVGLLQEGKLVLFLCHGCRGWSRKRPLHRAPDTHYSGHYMVLAGVEGNGQDQIFYVVDPGRNSDRAMRFIRYRELMSHAGGFWWVYQQGEPEERSSQNAG
jgi:hypothetical protein